MDEVIGLITANYSSEGLGELTSERTIASLPFGGRYRLIDFPLSNMIRADIRTVGIITPYKYRSIIDHIGSGKAWSLDRKRGGLYVLPGTVYGITSMDSRFLLRDIGHNRVFLMRSPAPYVLITASNTVCSMDYTKLYEAHKASGADITIAYKTAETDDMNLMGLRTEGDRVIGTTRGVKAGGKAAIDCFIIGRNMLLKIMDWYDAIDYLDFFEVLEEDYNKMDVRGYEYDGYVRSIFNTQSYYDYSMELLKPGVADELFRKNGMVITKIQDCVPTKYAKGAKVSNSLIPSGCRINGTVENSVIFREVYIGKNAVVKDSIVLQGCIIEDGAYVENTIIDRDNVVSSGTVLKGSKDSIFIKEKRAV